MSDIEVDYNVSLIVDESQRLQQSYQEGDEWRNISEKLGRRLSLHQITSQNDAKGSIGGNDGYGGTRRSADFGFEYGLYSRLSQQS